MPRTINGDSIASSEATPQQTRLEFIADGHQRTTTQGIYQDQDNITWYVKSSSRLEAVLEACSSNLFQFLSVNPCSPDVHFVEDQGKYFVMSKYTKFNDFDNTKSYPNLAMAILISFILSDGDCVNNKNIKGLGEEAFRFDFGGCMHGLESRNNDSIPFLTSISDLNTGFNTEQFRGVINHRDFDLYVHHLSKLNLEDFDWDRWAKAAGQECDVIYSAKSFIEERIRSVCAHVLNRHASSVMQNDDHRDLMGKLTEFYLTLRKYREQDGDVTFNPVDPAELAVRHINYYIEHNKHPDYFIDILKKAYSFHDGHLTGFNPGLSQYIVDQFNDKEYGVARIPRAQSTLEDILKLIDASLIKAPLADEFEEVKIKLIAAKSKNQHGMIRRIIDTVDNSKKQIILQKVIDAMNVAGKNVNEDTIKAVLDKVGTAIQENRQLVDESKYARNYGETEKALLAAQASLQQIYRKFGPRESDKDDNTRRHMK
jgi:hypothetical protein